MKGNPPLPGQGWIFEDDDARYSRCHKRKRRAGEGGAGRMSVEEGGLFRGEWEDRGENVTYHR